MKNLLKLVFLSIFIIFFSCTKENMESNKIEDNFDKKVSNKLLLDSDNINLYEQKFVKVGDILDVDSIINNIKKPGNPGDVHVVGPIYFSAQKVLAFENQLFLVANHPTLATGYYYGNVYRFTAYIPFTGTTAWVNNVNPMGFQTSTSNVIGYSHAVAVDANGSKTLQVTTWQRIVRYNMLGQYLGNISLPFSGDTFEVSYSYIP